MSKAKVIFTDPYEIILKLDLLLKFSSKYLDQAIKGTRHFAQSVRMKYTYPGNVLTLQAHSVLKPRTLYFLQTDVQKKKSLSC